MSRLLFTALLLAFAGSTFGQQLLVMKKGRVVARFEPGEDFYFQLKDQRQVYHVTLQTIREFYFTTMNRDSIAYTRIASVHFKNADRKKFGMTTALTSAGLLAVYGLNTIAFDERSPAMRGLRFVGITGVFVGTIIYLRSDRRVKMDGRKRLRYAAYDSPLYR